MIDTKLIAQLREKTGAGIVDVKAALEESGGDMAAAEESLRKKGILKAGKKSDRVAGEGIVYSYIHGNQKVGVMVELRCETDFVARTEGFTQLAHDIALHIAAMNPLYLDEAAVPQEVIDKEREIYKAEMAGSNKPEEIMGKIIEGKVAKFYTDVCLLKQQFIKDESMTIEEVIKHGIAKMGENIQLKRFVRFHLGQD
ncbi:MAG: elongation factor Ts [Candidatus Magasanikbacteria bacterium RIFCSPHIGHO2_01_FULL_50_8]|uniref:Elongation factor Ts n=2 Tax=Candidatus Magasanikiibacteriota TaxID=1752731 RepID=A0A1F6LSK6_9BACT|nr:MAG: elongation factor Ts [Candidatus Magasanikbacteria bacterium RIFCSPHIGHO2_01_FULL_50_8]OGH67905.1 MAG: elongation factor Ts [Candidatus Magasanikbacteria bacterium RIFCSPHIGHO2_02_FULL_50_9b]